MSQTWGDFQAVVQLSAGLNVAILSFVDISLPAIKERRRVFAKAQQELGMYRTAPTKLVSAQQLEHDCQVEEMNQKLYLLWQESADYANEEDTLVHYTGVMGFFGAVLSLVLLWYSAEYYDTPIGGLGQAVIALSFCSLVVAFIINFMTASQSAVFTQKCNDIRRQARQNLTPQDGVPTKPSTPATSPGA